MLRFVIAASVALCATSALAGTFPSPPLYPSFSSAKAQFLTIEPPGSTRAIAVAVNHKGEVAGYYEDKNRLYRGFIRKANGAFVKFGERKGNTVVSDMNDDGDVTGISGPQGFIRKADGTITKFDVPSTINLTLVGINNNGEIAGNYVGKDNIGHGFLRSSDGTITVVDGPGSSSGCNTYLSGVNLAGVAVGQDCIHVFVRDAQGHFTIIDPPRSSFCAATAITASGAVAGYCDGGALWGDSFIRDPSGSFTTVDAPTPKQGEIYIADFNRAGGTVGYYSNGQAFIRSAAGVFTKLRVPGGAISIFPKSINDRRQVAGYYYASDGSGTRAFLRTQ